MTIAQNAMRRRHWVILLVLVFAGCGSGGEDSASADASLQDVINARTKVVVLEKQAGELDRELRRLMHKVIAKAQGQQMAANV